MSEKQVAIATPSHRRAIRTKMLIFYLKYEKTKTIQDVNDLTEWALANGLDIFNTKLKVKYNEDLSSIKATSLSQLDLHDQLKLFYGGAQTKTHVELYENGSLNNSDSLVAGGTFNVKEFNLYQKALLHEFKFKGKDSPDFYGISLEGGKGVMVDNFGLRGSSGTFFNQINVGQLKQFYEYLNAKLIILQFGGNALPYITSKKQADEFGEYIKAQILIIKKVAPNASILVVGPADMGVKNGENYETHPQLENLRDAIRKNAFVTDCAFFDMYDCMGGKNSMLSWVEEGIGAKDYIHFSPQGARKIAVLLYASLINDYSNYIKKK